MTTQYDYTIIAILGLALAFLVALGVTAFLKRTRQFSLRSLLIVMTVVSVVLGLVAWAVRN